EIKWIMIPIFEPNSPHPSLRRGDGKGVIVERIMEGAFASGADKELGHPAGFERPFPADGAIISEVILLQWFLMPYVGMLHKGERKAKLLGVDGEGVNSTQGTFARQPEGNSLRRRVPDSHEHAI